VELHGRKLLYGTRESKNYLLLLVSPADAKRKSSLFTAAVMGLGMRFVLIGFGTCLMTLSDARRVN
jgi:hypothetical protein